MESLHPLEGLPRDAKIGLLCSTSVCWWLASWQTLHSVLTNNVCSVSELHLPSSDTLPARLQNFTSQNTASRITSKDIVMRFLETGDAGMGLLCWWPGAKGFGASLSPLVTSCLGSSVATWTADKDFSEEHSSQISLTLWATKKLSRKRTENEEQENMPDPCLVTVKAGPQHSRVGLTQYWVNDLFLQGLWISCLWKSAEGQTTGSHVKPCHWFEGWGKKEKPSDLNKLLHPYQHGTTS